MFFVLLYDWVDFEIIIVERIPHTHLLICYCLRPCSKQICCFLNKLLQNYAFPAMQTMFSKWGKWSGMENSSKSVASLCVHSSPSLVL